MTEFEKYRVILAFQSSGLSVSAFCAESPDAPSVATLYRWVQKHAQGGIEALRDNYHSPKNIAPIVRDTDKDILLAWYLRPQRPSIAFCFREYQRGGGQASYDTVRRFLKHLPPAIRDRYRLGKERARAKYAPYGERDYEALEPLEIVCMDHHRMDCLINHAGKLCRPWLSAAQDLRSRKILAAAVVLQADEMTVARVLQDVCTGYGIPHAVLIDHGKDYGSKLFSDPKTGIYPRLGIRVHKAQPYHGQSKPIERFFRTFTENFTKTLESYVGSNTADRPEDVALYYRAIKKQHKRDCVLSLKTLEQRVLLWMREFNETWSHTGKGMHNRTPNAVYAAHYTPRPVLNKADALQIFSRSFVRTVQRNGITIDGISYYAPELAAYKGLQVLSQRALADIAHIVVYDRKSNYKICQAHAEYNVFASAEDAIKASKKKHAAEKRALQKLQDLQDLQELQEQTELPQYVHKKTKERYIFTEPSSPRTARPAGHKKEKKTYTSPLLTRQR